MEGETLLPTSRSSCGFMPHHPCVPGGFASPLPCLCSCHHGAGHSQPLALLVASWMPFALRAAMSPVAACPLWTQGWTWQLGKGHAVGPWNPWDVPAAGEHPSPAKWGSALADLQAMRGAGLDPAGTAVPARGLGFTQEGQRDTARKWSNPSPAAGGAPVTKPNGARPAERSRAPGSEIAFQGAGGRGNVAAPP